MSPSLFTIEIIFINANAADLKISEKKKMVSEINLLFLQLLDKQL